MRQKGKVIFLILTILTLQTAFGQFNNFITKKGDKLFDGDKEYRFISFNIPNLHYVEDYLPFNGTNPWRLPTEYEIRDALRTIKIMGGKVTRMYVLSVRSSEDEAGIIRHVEGPGQFNEEAFKALDKVLQIANEEGVRVIIPFVDNWHWWGGPKEYAAFRNKEKPAFWKDTDVINDFKRTIEFVINRKNTYTGVLYKDDKSIMAWETGNELEPPFEWTKNIAAYIKSLDQNHLLIEGIFAKDLSYEAVEDPNLDILSTHHYGDPKLSLEKISSNIKMAKGKKPYFVGEYGIVPTQYIKAMTDTIINSGIAGGMLWSIRPRCEEGGFYHHFEYNNTEAYRFPGFASGEWYDEKAIIQYFRGKAYQIDGQNPPFYPVPSAPVMLEIKNVGEISWQGSTGALSYIIERKVKGGDWEEIANNVEDHKYAYRPIFSDETAQTGKEYFYRLRAKNESGISDYSNIAGPVLVAEKKIADEMENFNRIFQKDGNLELLTYQDIRKAKEDRSRLTGKEESYIVYKLPENATGIKVEYFAVKSGSEVKISLSENGKSYDNQKVEREIFAFAKNNYGFFDAVADKVSIDEDSRFVKIELNPDVQISRIEINYK